jgi:hypothetical protein
LFLSYPNQAMRGALAQKKYQNSCPAGSLIREQVYSLIMRVK